MPKYCYLNGKIIPQNKASLSITDLGVLRGYGVFEFLRTYNGKPFLVREHLARFRRSADLVNIKVPIINKEIESIIFRLLKKNKDKESNIKLILTGGTLERNKPTLYIFTEKLIKLSATLYRKGIKLAIHEHRRELARAKSLNYLTAFRLQSWRKRQRAYEILYISDGRVLECTTSNFFIVKNNKLITPKDNILIGTTRNFVLKLARGKYKIEERDVSLKDINNADEAFITATNKEILPVVRIDMRKVGNGKLGRVTGELIELFNKRKY